MRAIVSTFRKVSTKTDQAQSGPLFLDNSSRFTSFTHMATERSGARTTATVLKQWLLCGAVLAIATTTACSPQGGHSSRTSSLPTAPTALAVERSTEGTVVAHPTDADSEAPLALPLPVQSANPLATFPPRNEPFQFRQTLETYYQSTLRRSPIPTAVDLEGAIVWTQEYLRYRLSACDHLTAVSKVLQQIGTGGNPSECGGSASFPPRNEPFDFRSNHLESKYRDGLRRAPTLTYVDIEGDIVWTTEYFRYRLSGCGHADATTKTLAQVGGGGAPATCQSLFSVWTSANQGWSSIAVTVNGRAVGTLTRYLEPNTTASCSASDGARVTVEVPPGLVTVSARSERGVSWNSSTTAGAGQCSGLELTCTNRNCGATVTPTPTPTPTPTLGAYDGIVVTRVRGCDYFIADGPRGYFLLQWWSGYDPTVGDAFVGNVASYGFKDLLYNSARRPGRVWVDDYLLSGSRAVEKLASKCR